MTVISKKAGAKKSAIKAEHEPMRVLGIRQPWAEIILRRRKPFELRTWSTKFRGTLLIHASQQWFAARSAPVMGISKEEVPLGAIVGIAKLVDVRPFTKADAALLKKKGGSDGWWRPGYCAWVLESVHRIEPIPFKGQRGLFAPPLRIVRKIEAEIAARKTRRKRL